MPAWPYPETPAYERRSRWTFKAGWANTLTLLEREIEHLDGREVILGGGFREQDIRLDGLPRSDARDPAFPGIEISFELPDRRRLVYATDVCDHWQHNVRSIALGLEALRAVNRYGITRRGEQYAGFAQLPPGGPDPDRGRRLVEAAGGMTQALKRHHPDHGGEARDFADVDAYRKVAST
ncbi:MAG TPA: hypothetical protein VM305_08315 [Candidatus Limnocylindrales bacterium]|nr:hypothetical protein [Candidatus Limnocylindrales bacterium]